MIKKTKHTSVIAQDKNLSIQFSLDGFSFCIKDFNTKECILFTEYNFEETITTPELLLNKIAAIFNENKNLQGDFKSIDVIHINNLCTLVPNIYFDETALKSYLSYSIKTLANDLVVYDEITNLNAKNVYIPFVNINNYLFQNFGAFEFKHHSSVLISKLIKYNTHLNERLFFVNVFDKSIDIIVKQASDLILYNSFSYETKEDFIYYILFVAEQLEMDPNEFQLTFMGAIAIDTEIYNITYTYIRNINFMPITSDFFKNSEDFNNHSNYLLLS